MTDPLPTPDTPSTFAGATVRRRAAISMLVAIVCLGVRWPLLTTPGFIQDQVYFLHWAGLAERGGVGAVYENRANGQPWCNYPPVYPYVLRALAGVYRMGTGQPLGVELIGDIIENRPTPQTAAASALFKMPAVIADGLTCALLVLWLSRRTTLRTAAAVSLLYALMPPVIFDSAVWGQVDSIPTLFLLIALECATQRRWVWVGVFAALAILTKPQAIVLAPLFLIAATFADRRALVSLLRLGAGAAIVSVLVLAPLWSVRAGIEQAYTEAAGHYPFVHLNGFSAWFLANPLSAPRLENLAGFYRRDDAPILLGLAARQIGFVAMAATYFAVLYRVGRMGATGPMIRFAARVLPLAFVVVCTQMHERYLVPAIALWAWAWQPSRCWWIGWLMIAGVAFFNLLWVWEQPLAFQSLSSLADWTRSSPGGIATGNYCAIALMIVLVMSLIVADRRTPAGGVNG